MIGETNIKSSQQAVEFNSSTLNTDKSTSCSFTPESNTSAQATSPYCVANILPKLTNMDATSFAGTFMISNRRRENSTSSSGASGSSISGTSYGSGGSSYGSTPSSSGSYFPQSNKGSQNGYGDNRKLSNKCNSSMPF